MIVHVALTALFVSQFLAFPLHTEAAPVTAGISLSKTTVVENYSSPVNITATASDGPTFDTDVATDVKVINRNTNAVVSSATISNIAVASTTSMSFTLGTGLPAGDYQFRFVRSDNTTYYANFSVVTPQITLSDNSIPAGYTSSVSITVTGTNTNFAAGQTTVTVLNGSNASTGKAGTPTISNSTSLSFSLATGLTAGTYTVQVSTTGKETVTATLAVVTPSVSLSPNSASKGYNSPVSVTVTGTNTEFSGATTTVSILDSQDASAATPTNLVVASATSLSFSIPTGLTDDTYEIKITTGVETVSQTFTVYSANISLQESNQALSSITEGYTSSKTITVIGQYANFSASTTVTLKDSNNTEVAGKISGVTSSSSTSLSFTLATGLTAGAYTITTTTNGVAASALFNVVKPTISSNLDTKISKDYKSAKTVQVTGVNTSFQDGITTVQLINVATDEVSDKTSGLQVTGLTALNFTLNTGLPEGEYKIRTVTNGIVTDTTQTYTVTTPSVDLDPSSVVANLSNKTITVTGTNTNFVSGVTKAVFLNNDGTSVNGISVPDPAVTSATNLTVNLTTSSPLSVGTYKLRISTSNSSINEVVEKNITVSSSTINFQAGNSFKEGYSAQSVTIQGTGTNFTSNAVVRILDGDTVVQTIDTITVSSTTLLSFTLPAGLAANADTPKSYTLDIDGVQTSLVVIAVTDVEVTANSSQVNMGSNLQLTATGTFSNAATEDMTGKATWSSSNNSIATVSNSGLVTGVAEGTATITAAFNDSSGQLQITVVDPNKPVVTGVVTGKTYTESVTPKFTTGTATLLVNGTTEAFTSGTTIDENGTYTLTVTNNAGSTVVIFTINKPETNTTPSTDGGGGIGGGGGGLNPVSDEPALEPDEHKMFTGFTNRKESNEEGKPVSKVTIDSDKLKDAFKSDPTENSTKVIKVTLEITDAEDLTEFELTGDSLSESALTNPEGLLEFKSNQTSFELPLNLLDFDQWASEFNTSVSKLKVNVIIEKVSGDDQQNIEQKTQAAGLKLLSDAVEFRLTIEGNGKSQEVEDFVNTYISRSIEVEGTLNHTKTTAVLIDKETGEAVFVPSIFTVEGGKTKVTMKRTGNSVYSVVQYEKSFEDTIQHWAKSDIELLASKLIIKGKSEKEFKPNDNITRAEFAALLIRALGIQPETPNVTFTDVTSSAWYADDIQAAYQAGLVNGRTKSTFAPNDLISRQDMAVMIANALAFAGKSANLNTSETNNLLKTFGDSSQINSYANIAVAQAAKLGIITGMPDGSFAPADNANRAQAAVMLNRLLVALEFINAK